MASQASSSSSVAQEIISPVGLSLSDAGGQPIEINSIKLIPHKHSAPIWQYYDKVLINDSILKAKCKTCNKLLAVGGNSTLVRHREHDLGKAAPSEATQAQIGIHGQTWTYDQALQRQLQMQCVIQQGLPFNHYDNEPMTEYIQQGLQPKYQRVSRSTLRRDAFKAFVICRNDLIKYFSLYNGKVSLTSDVWSAPNNVGMSYICITCHWIDPSTWEMCKRIINFQSFEHPHNAQAIYQVIMSCITRYKIRDKIFSISFDNASNNTSSIELLNSALNPILDGIFFHSRCVCHILNLVVQIGLSAVDPIIKNIKNVLIFIYSSPKRRQDYKAFCRSNGVKFLSPDLDMPIRWNSTYKMLHKALRHKDLLTQFYNMTRVDNRISLTNNDWVICESLVKLLQVFHDATKVLSGVYYSTSSQVLGQLLLITLSFEEYRNHPFWGSSSPSIIELMVTKFKKYFDEIPPIFTCAAALNPTLGVEGVENILEVIANNLGVDPIQSKNHFNNCLTNLYDHYDLLYGNIRRDVDDDQIIGSESSRTILKMARFKKQKSTFNELAFYNKTNFDIRDVDNFDILDFWKHKSSSSNYPIMGAMARDILTIQASTVASESAFSLSGRILNERRCRLSPEALEVCVCFKDHLDGNRRMQHINSAEDISNEVEDDYSTDEEIED